MKEQYERIASRTRDENRCFSEMDRMVRNIDKKQGRRREKACENVE